MHDIIVTKINESKIKIHTNSNIHAELSGHFAARPEGFQFMPLYINGLWDGYKRYYTYGSLRIGLLDHLKKFATKNNYTIDIQYEYTMYVDYIEFQEFVKTLEIPLEIRDYQMRAAWDICVHKNVAAELPTASGKSLVMYIVVRFLLLLAENFKMLIVVSQTGLVEQIYKEFYDYGWKSIDDHVHKIYGGKQKTFEKSLIITTWQSVFREKKIFAMFDAFLIDESHHAKSKSLLKVTDNCINASWRIGTSGTYSNPKTAEWYATVGAIGPIVKYASYKELEEQNYLSSVSINNLFLKYNKDIHRQFIDNAWKNYQQEIEFINNLDKRNNFIVKIASLLQNNTIVLFTRIKHGKLLRDQLRTVTKPKKHILYIDGKTPVDKREKIRYIMERRDDIVLIASFGTFSEGANVKNIHNIIFASNYKSKIKVLQAIGRGLRILKDKKEVIIFDLIDDFSILKEDRYGNVKKHKNYTLKHYDYRKSIYKKMGFENVRDRNIKVQ